MASIAISASLQTVCSSHQVTKQPQSKPGARSLGTKEATRVVALNVEANSLNVSAQEESALRVEKHKAEDAADSKSKDGLGGAELSVVKFRDKRWKNGTWDLNMFSKNGKMDWDGIILAEAKRRKFLELHPEASTNDDPAVFRSSIIPWWAWMMRYYLPEAELINGRAAMVGFVMAYVVDALTGLGVVGQTGNFICKAGFFVTVIAIILIKISETLGSLLMKLPSTTSNGKLRGKIETIKLEKRFKCAFQKKICIILTRSASAYPFICFFSSCHFMDIQ